MDMQNNTVHIIISLVIFLIISAIVFSSLWSIFKWLKKRSGKTKSIIDDYIIDLLKMPSLWFSFWILLKIFSYNSFLSQTSFFDSISKINDVLLILTFGWIVIKVVKALFYYSQKKLDVTISDNLDARKSLTRMKIFEIIIVTIISIVTIGICLMTFDSVRSIGVSLLTSAGIAGIIIGFAAQSSIATIFAGMQLAITQPIRLDDVLIVEGEWGRVEEITLTYVVVKIWDERRLVLPVKYFLEKPFQNWTRSTSNILGTIFLYVDYKLPLEALREHLNLILTDHPRWDKRVANIQVTDTKEAYKELRVLLSSKDASFNWELRVDIREKLIDFINENYPGCFVKNRVMLNSGE